MNALAIHVKMVAHVQIPTTTIHANVQVDSQELTVKQANHMLM